MKKIVLTVLIAASIVTSSFAKTGEEKNKVNYKVINEFAASFSDAENVQWKVTNEFIKATFEMEEQIFEAFYNASGEFLGKSQKIEFTKLPKKAIAHLKLQYLSSNYTVKDCIKLTNGEGDTNYFVSLKKDKVETVLQISTKGEVGIYTK